MKDINKLKKLAKLVRYYSLTMSSEAGSGHPTSSLSSTDLMTALFFNVFKYDLKDPDNIGNDRLIFSKGHASPLYYALFAVAGVIKPEELMRYRKIDSNLEGHPTPTFLYTEAATGSLGQGLSIGVGEALALRYKLKKLPRVFVLLGDGEMAEGSVWEAIEIASHYKLSHLIGILDVNRLGQSGETMLGSDTSVYEARLKAFGWHTITVNGHDYSQIIKAYKNTHSSKPTMIIAKTIKGKGVSFLENKEGWHGKVLDSEKLKVALKELGKVDTTLTGKVENPPKLQSSLKKNTKQIKMSITFKKGEEVPTREAYGQALVQLGKNPLVVALDGDTKNSTYSEYFKNKYPGRFFEMFIAEQNMVGSAIGMSKRGLIPFASTFSAFFTRSFDQIRMGAVSRANIKLVGSHGGVSIGEDGPSQMGLEDLSMMKVIYGSIVFYPSDAVSAMKLTALMPETPGIVYLRTTRGKTPVIYSSDDEFIVGGSKVFKSSGESKVLIIAAGVTVHEALEAQKELKKDGIEVTVVDCYSIKPIDAKTIGKLSQKIKGIITVEDHWIEGGLGDGVLEALARTSSPPVYKLGVTHMPRSGKPKELMKMVGISKEVIVKKVKKILQ